MRWSKSVGIPKLQPLLGSLSVGILCGFFFSFYMVDFSHRYGNLVDTRNRERFVRASPDPFRDLSLRKGFDVANETDQKWHEYVPNDLTARLLYQKVRLLCWILTGAENHETKARHIKATWGKRCNILLFMSSKQDDSLPTVAIPMGEGRQKLWGKTKEAFRYVYENYFDKADWFFKADDDTFAIPENARYMLSRYNTSEPMWFGCRFKMHVEGGYMSGGAGYILSKEAVKRFVTVALKNITICKVDDHTGAEDAEMGKCLKNVGVSARDSRDEYGRERFLPFAPSHHVTPGNMTREYWYWNSIYYKAKQGDGACSDTAISFHYIPSNDLYVMNYLIYGLRPYGIEGPAYPQGWTAPPPPDLEGTATPWIGAQKEYEERLEKDVEFRKEEEEKEKIEKEKRAKEEEEKRKKEEEDRKKHEEDEKRIKDEAEKKRKEEEAKTQKEEEEKRKKRDDEKKRNEEVEMKKREAKEKKNKEEDEKKKRQANMKKKEEENTKKDEEEKNKKAEVAAKLKREEEKRTKEHEEKNVE